MIQTFLTALLGGVVALSGNAIMHLLQNRAKVREERRAWVRTLHPETVGVVVDMDLFNRSLRAAVVAGADTEKESGQVRSTIDDRWEGDLLKRLRALYFGHPDPDVRRAAEMVEDAAWPYMTAARHAYEEDGPFRFDPDKRKPILDTMNAAMVEFRRAVYAAPIRKLPKVEEYSGEERPSYLARSIAAKEAEKNGAASR